MAGIRPVPEPYRAGGIAHTTASGTGEPVFIEHAVDEFWFVGSSGSGDTAIILRGCAVIYYH